MSSVIKVKRFSKEYFLRLQKQEHYTSLHDVLAHDAKRSTHVWGII
jgi:hypothetical protein